jgi:hypothetical protein
MPLRSHVDLSLFVRYVHVTGESVTQETLDSLERADNPNEAFAAWRSQLKDQFQVVFHETYHYWQGLRLPYLYWHAVSTTPLIFQAFRELNHSFARLHDWACSVPALHVLTVPRWCGWRGNDKFVVAPVDAADSTAVASVVLSPLDLLESAASLSEFQAVARSREALADPVAFRRWYNRNRSYTTAYRFAVHVLGNDAITLRCLLSLICASFETNDPVRAFVSLLASLKLNLRREALRAFIDQAEPCRWSDLFQMLLETMEFEAMPDSEFGWAPNQPFFRLTLAQWVNASWSGSDGFGHPFLTLRAREWLKREADNPGYSRVVPQLGWADLEASTKCWEDFQPPVTVARFDLGEGRNRVLIIGRLTDGMDLQGIPLADYMALHSVVRRATGINFDPDHRLCHHKNCPEFGPNYCNSYPNIPKNYQDCGFPPRVANLRKLMVYPSNLANDS